MKKQFRNFLFKLKIKFISYVKRESEYTVMQKLVYKKGTSNHEEHNANKDYWDILLGPLKNNNYSWKNKKALDFGCGKGRNIINIIKICDFSNVDGIDISEANIEFCKRNIKNNSKSKFYISDGKSLAPIKNSYYDFIVSTIVLQHICVFDIRDNILRDIFRVLKNGGILSFQMGYDKKLLDENGKNKLTKYYENNTSALGTNSSNDVAVQDEKEVINHLEDIGFMNIKTKISNSFSDIIHENWIYVLAEKP